MAFTPRLWPHAAASFSFAIVSSLSPPVAAQECRGDKPWVAVSSRAPEALTTAVRSELRAGLAPSRIDVCEEAPGAEPLALLTFEEVDAATARYRLEVTDAVTKKRVSRDLGLTQLPPDGRALALAVAAEELLRASWAELALRGVHGAGSEAPPEVRAVVERAEPPASSPRHSGIGARLAFEHFAGGQTHLGGDLFGSLPLGRVASLLGALGARRALTVQAPHGSITATALGAEAGLSLSFLQRSSIDWAGFVSGRVLRLAFVAEAADDEGADATSGSGLAVSARAGMSFAFGRPGLMRSYTTLGAGLPLRSFSAADSGRVVTGASELELFGSTGLALELP